MQHQNRRQAGVDAETVPVRVERVARRVERPSATAEFWEETKLRAKLDHAEGKAYAQAAERGEVDGRLQWGHLPHLVLTLLTGGLWAPVWIWKSLSDERAMRRTPVIRQARAERYDALEELAAKQARDRKAFQRQQRADAAEKWRQLGRRITGRGGR